VKLAVTPNITNTGFVKMQLQPEQLILAGFSGTPPVPIIDSRKAVTNVIVKDEDTVVIGGLREINTVRNTEQVPWIGQAPIIGWFFKSNIKSHRKNELMLFVTPRIVKSPVLTPAENYQYSRIDAHWDLPDFFFDDSVDSRERNTSVLNDPAMYQNRSLNLPVPTN
jgi:type II secretory pathway component GspD/PulD (secretin)